MNIIVFSPNDLNEMITLFRESVARVGNDHYTPEQLKAWAPDDINEVRWLRRFEMTYTVLVKAPDKKLLGFANLEPHGTIDMIYVHADFQGQGIASRLIAELERYAREHQYTVLSADASKIAKPFFEARGFLVQKEYEKKHLGQVFKNFLMFKRL